MRKDSKKLSEFDTFLRTISYNAFKAYENKIELSDKVLLKGIGGL